MVCCGKVTLIHYQNVSTNVNDVNFSDMFLKSQKIFKNIWKNDLENRLQYLDLCVILAQGLF